MTVQCPACGSENEELVKIEAGLRLRLQELNVTEREVPAEVCTSCFRDLSKSVSQGAKLRAEINAKEHNKKILWKNRISLIKSARERMSVKALAEAAVLYEKYIKTIEMNQEVAPGQIDFAAFKSSGNDKELTLIASAYWDLMRIYDARPNYTKKMEDCAAKLLEIIPLCAAGKDIIHRAEKFSKSANNSKLIRNFIKDARKRAKSSCFIASAVFYDDYAPEVVSFKVFRDDILLQYKLGRFFVYIYYTASPKLVKVLDRFPWLKPMVRKLLRSIALRLPTTLRLKS